MSLDYPDYFLYLLLFLFSMPLCSAHDCLADGSMITDGTGNTSLVSPGNVFQLGFFTPDGSFNNNRYLGIWYYNSNPNIVVWVANREKPLLVSNGYLVIKDGKAEILDRNDSAYWTTNSDASVNSTKFCLSDQGNLILSDHQGKLVLWQSFDHPTDTLLPGMMLKGSLTLTSWLKTSDPAPCYTHFLLQSGNDPSMVIIEGSTPSWDSEAGPSARVPFDLSKLSGDGITSLPNNTRLVMNFSGQIQLWKLGNDSAWFLDWVEPKDRCSFKTKCGNFGSCNSNNGLPCKCLPGFKPSLLEEWNFGCFKGGCVPDSGTPCQRNDSFKDIFMRLPMMKVGEVDCSGSTEMNCEAQCLWDCTCVAYSYGVANCEGTGNRTEKRCLTWTNLPLLQEEYSQGLTLYVRAPFSDIGFTSRDCKPCGTYAIPYPLSTDGAKCGDSSYSNLLCYVETGQVNFSTPLGTFRVALIDPDAKMLTIQVMHANSCETDYLNSFVPPSKTSFPFDIKSCSVVKNNPSIQLEQPFIEVNLGWQSPPEPTCNGFADCLSWSHTSCKAAKGGKRRCVCRSNYHWDGLKLMCIRDSSRIKIVVPCIAAAVAIILLSVVIINLKHRRRIAKKQLELKDDTEGLDAPFFSWESILAATNSFAEANKLGRGGFGCVYKGKLPEGKEIAVKRLSELSVQGVSEFRTEVLLIARLQHRNLVKLLGYCLEAEEKILVYEYMPNGSLDSCLFDRTLSVNLDWEKRFDIIFGIARGLVYLHQDSRLRIIHRDLKPSNILLDEELNPKISDFGLARIVGGKETEANTTRVVGTYGYMSPEYACEGLFSFKSDVFSFGVIVLETINGQRNTRSSVFEQGLSLLGHAWRLWTEGRALEFMDPSLKESCNPTEVLTCIYVALLCIQDDPIDRPTMSTVVLLLSSESSASNSHPKKPAFFTRVTTSESASITSLGGRSSFSGNMITVSTLGR